MRRLFIVNASFVGLFASWTSSAQDTPAVQTIATEAAHQTAAASPTGMLLTGLAVMVAIAVRRIRAQK